LVPSIGRAKSCAKILNQLGSARLGNNSKNGGKRLGMRYAIASPNSESAEPRESSLFGRDCYFQILDEARISFLPRRSMILERRGHTSDLEVSLNNGLANFSNLPLF